MLSLLALAEAIYGEISDVDWVQALAEVLAGGSPMIPQDREEFKTLFGMVVAIDSTMADLLEMVFYGFVKSQSGSGLATAAHFRILEKAEECSFWPSRGQLRFWFEEYMNCLLYTSPSPRDRTRSRMPSSA